MRGCEDALCSLLELSWFPHCLYTIGIQRIEKVFLVDNSVQRKIFCALKVTGDLSKVSRCVRRRGEGGFWRVGSWRRSAGRPGREGGEGSGLRDGRGGGGRGAKSPPGRTGQENENGEP